MITAGDKFVSQCGKLLEVIVEPRWHDKPGHFLAVHPHKEFFKFPSYEVDSITKKVIKEYPPERKKDKGNE